METDERNRGLRVEKGVRKWIKEGFLGGFDEVGGEKRVDWGGGKKEKF